MIEACQTLEVEIAAIHHIEGTGLGNELIEDVDVVEFAIRDMQESRDIPAQIEQRVQLHRCLRRAKRRPRKERQAQIDGRGIERVDRVGQLHAERLVRIELAGHRNQPLGELGIDAPVAHGVGVGERIARDRRAQPHVVELLGLHPQAGLDVAQALAKGQLREDHDQQLLEAGEALDLVLAVVPSDAATKCGERQMRRQLCKDQLPSVHGNLGAQTKYASDCRNRGSNRDQRK